MRTGLRGAVLGLLVALAGVAARAERSHVTPVFGRIVAFTAPDRFRPAYEAGTAQSYILELVPKGESVDTWSEIITLTATRPSRAPAAMVAIMDRQLRRACPARVSGFDMGRVGQGRAHFFACDRLEDGRGQNFVIIAFASPEAIFTLQYARRSQPGAGIDRDDAARRLAVLRRFRLCAPVPGEGAPYPSCLRG
jgi:hypothetical protein